MITNDDEWTKAIEKYQDLLRDISSYAVTHNDNCSLGAMYNMVTITMDMLNTWQKEVGLKLEQSRNN